MVLCMDSTFAPAHTHHTGKMSHVELPDLPAGVNLISTRSETGVLDLQIRISLPRPTSREPLESWVISYLDPNLASPDVAAIYISETATLLQTTSPTPNKTIDAVILSCSGLHRRLAMLIFVRCFAFQQAIQSPAFKKSSTLLSHLQTIVFDPWMRLFVPPPCPKERAARVRIVDNDCVRLSRVGAREDLCVASEAAETALLRAAHCLMGRVVSSGDFPIQEFMIKLDGPGARVHPKYVNYQLGGSLFPFFPPS